MADENIFSGLKVVDLASFIAGPGAATILSDFGADVIKVEPPERRAVENRAEDPAAAAFGGNLSLPFGNRNKRGVALNLKSASAQQVLERLAKWADVFIVNTPHPARKNLKLEYDDVAQWNPRLIYADLTGFGEKGPDSALPGFDLTAYWARSGLLFMTRDAGEPPTWPVAGSGDQCHCGRALCRDCDRALSSRTHRQRILCHDFASRGRCLVGQRVYPGSPERCKFLWAARSSESRKCSFEYVSLFRWHLVRSRSYSGQDIRGSEGNRP